LPISKLGRSTTSNNKTPRGANSLCGSHHGEFFFANYYYLRGLKNGTVTSCNSLKLEAADGKIRLTNDYLGIVMWINDCRQIIKVE